MRRLPAVIDLFCGAGGLTLGASRAGFRVAAGFDRDRQALDIHEANFPACHAVDGNLGEITAGQLLKLAGEKRIDGIIGGPPCQGFSTMGKRDTADPRNLLFARFFAYVARLRPHFFLAENVPGILAGDSDKVVQAGLGLVAGDYHVLAPIIVNAADFGAPTARKRVFFIGFKRKIDETAFTAAIKAMQVKRPVTVRDALFGIGSPEDHKKLSDGRCWGKVRWGGHSEDFAARLQDCIPQNVGDHFSVEMLQRRRLASGFQLTRHTAAVRRRFAAVKPGDTDPVSRAMRLDPLAFCPVLRAGTGPEHGSFTALRPIHSWEPRVVIPREAARLQGFPDWFLMHHTIWHSLRHIGNSVSPIVAEKILSVIKRFM